MKVRFLADEDFNQNIVAGLLLREPLVDFALPQGVNAEGTKDPQVLRLGASLGRVIVNNQVRTMPGYFATFVADRAAAGTIPRHRRLRRPGQMERWPAG